MERMKKNVKGIPVWLIVLIMIALIATVSAYVMWQRTTKIIVEEPLEVSTNLPEEVALLPGVYNYAINVTNHGGIAYNATLRYSVETENCSITISPTNGTSLTVPAGETVTFEITITVDIKDSTQGGTATIRWSIDRTSVS